MIMQFSRRLWFFVDLHFSEGISDLIAKFLLFIGSNGKNRLFHLLQRLPPILFFKRCDEDDDPFEVSPLCEKKRKWPEVVARAFTLFLSDVLFPHPSSFYSCPQAWLAMLKNRSSPLARSFASTPFLPLPPKSAEGGVFLRIEIVGGERSKRRSKHARVRYILFLLRLLGRK